MKGSESGGRGQSGNSVQPRSSSKISNTEQYMNLKSQHDAKKREFLIQTVREKLTKGNPLELMLLELQVPPDKRSAESIETIKQATSEYTFFKSLSEDPKYNSKSIHDKLCRCILLSEMQAGYAPILKSNLLDTHT